MTWEHCEDNNHVFECSLPGWGPHEDVPDEVARREFPPDLSCECGAFTWAHMNAIERDFDTLEAMWAGSP